MTIDQSEVLRYLGYTNQNIDPNMASLLEQCIIEIKELAVKNFIFDVYDIDQRDHAIALKDTVLVMESKDIVNHLAQSDKCVLMAASLGLEVDMRIAFYSKTITFNFQLIYFFAII